MKFLTVTRSVTHRRAGEDEGYQRRRSEVKCAKKVFDGWRYHQCSRNATRDGFCGQHHPDAEAERLRKSREKYEAERAAKMAPFLRAKRMESKLRELMGEADFAQWDSAPEAGREEHNDES